MHGHTGTHAPAYTQTEKEGEKQSISPHSLFSEEGHKLLELEGSEQKYDASHFKVQVSLTYIRERGRWEWHFRNDSQMTGTKAMKWEG